MLFGAQVEACLHAALVSTVDCHMATNNLPSAQWALQQISSFMMLSCHPITACTIPLYPTSHAHPSLQPRDLTQQ